jgi:hypothetical protein
VSERPGRHGGFRYSPPIGVTWTTLGSEPIVGPDALGDLRGIREQHGRLRAWRLSHAIANLSYEPLSVTAEKIRDPPGVGPRYMCDIGFGYVAACWVLAPPPEWSGAGPRIWVERVVLRAEVEAAVLALAPDDE